MGLFFQRTSSKKKRQKKMTHLNYKVFELPRLYFHFLYQTVSEFKRLTFHKGSLHQGRKKTSGLQWFLLPTFDQNKTYFLSLLPENSLVKDHNQEIQMLLFPYSFINYPKRVRSAWYIKAHFPRPKVEEKRIDKGNRIKIIL